MSGLFNISDISIESKALQSVAMAADDNNAGFTKTKASRLMEDITLLLDQEGHTTIHFLTAGALSLHKLMDGLLERHPGQPCKLWIATWAIKEAAARAILKHRNSGHVVALYGIFDSRVKTVDSKAFQLLQDRFTQCVFAKNHSKVMVIEFPDHQYTIVTSANLSNNPRIETGFVTTGKALAEFHRGWMRDVLNNGKAVY
jgi:hypothetical protein